MFDGMIYKRLVLYRLKINIIIIHHVQSAQAFENGNQSFFKKSE